MFIYGESTIVYASVGKRDCHSDLWTHDLQT